MSRRRFATRALVVGAVAGEAVIRENRPHIAVEIDRFLRALTHARQRDHQRTDDLPSFPSVQLPFSTIAELSEHPPHYLPVHIRQPEIAGPGT